MELELFTFFRLVTASEMGICFKKWKVLLKKLQGNMYLQGLVNNQQQFGINILDGTTVENKGKLILTEIFPSLQKHDI